MFYVLLFYNQHLSLSGPQYALDQSERGGCARDMFGDNFSYIFSETKFKIYFKNHIHFGWIWWIKKLPGLLNIPSYRTVTMISKKRDFDIHLMKNHVYHLKALKNWYRRHLNGSYRFPSRNSEKRGSKFCFGQIFPNFYNLEMNMKITFFCNHGHSPIGILNNPRQLFYPPSTANQKDFKKYIEFGFRKYIHASLL